MTLNYDPILGLQYFNTQDNNYLFSIDLDCIPPVNIKDAIYYAKEMGVCFMDSCGKFMHVEKAFIKHNLYYLLAQ